MRLYDAHNHLQDDRLAPWRDEILATLAKAGVARVVVNGTCEKDWPAVLALAREQPMVLASFGYHPWAVRERTTAWQRRLVECLDQVPSAVGEIGLDRWILDPHNRTARPGPSGPPPAPIDEQAEVFAWQLRVAAERNVPVSIHCLRAWGLLHDVLRQEPRPDCGVLLHSYGGPSEMIRPLADLGAYFSLPGAFARDGKERRREAFRCVPPDRLLLETDAPDQCLPRALDPFRLRDPAAGGSLNHPGNLSAVYGFAADLLGESTESLAARVEQNFKRLFAPCLASQRAEATR